MDQFQEMIRQQRRWQLNELEKSKKEIAQLPKGAIVKRKKNCYVQNINGKERAITGNEELIRGLARKRYLKPYIKTLENNVKLLEKLENRYQTIDAGQIISEFSATYQSVPEAYFFNRPEDGFAGETFETNKAHPERLIYRTNRGELVRSKSEREIANTLYAMEIPYRYEACLILGGEKRFPDFTLFRKRDRQLLYWEHFGLTDDASYTAGMCRKLEEYRDHGVIPWKNLICTYEEDITEPERISYIIRQMLM